MFNPLKQNAKKEFCSDVKNPDCETKINGNVMTVTINRTKEIGDGRKVDEQKKEVEKYKGSMGGVFKC